MAFVGQALDNKLGQLSAEHFLDDQRRGEGEGGLLAANDMI